LQLLEFCFREVEMVRITYSREEKGEELVATSIYLPYDSD
jgi:hypothetical protein